MEAEGGGNGGGCGSDGGGGGISLEMERKQQLQGEPKVKRKMKSASQLEVLERTYAIETYPSEALRAELSAQLGLSDRQLQMWFCHRRLKDRKRQTVKQSKKDIVEATMLGSSSGVGDEGLVSIKVGDDRGSRSLLGSSHGSYVDMELHQQRVVHRAGTALVRYGAEIPAMRRHYEPQLAISELRAIAFVEAQLGEPLREDGPILGMEFDPLPPGAFGAPIVTSGQQKPAGRPFEPQLYERQNPKPIKGSTRALYEYQFLPVQPCVRNDALESAVPSHRFGSSTNDQTAWTTITAGRSLAHANDEVHVLCSHQNPAASLTLLPHRGKQFRHLAGDAAETNVVPQEKSLVNIAVDAHYGVIPFPELGTPFVSSDPGVINNEGRLERKRKPLQSEEARIAREVQAHEKRIRKELKRQNILQRRQEEQMRKEMERQHREKQKEGERLLREKQREVERLQREQRREMQRREKFLLKESIKVEKMRLKEETRRERETARQKASIDRAAARKIARESTDLIEDEHLELMELAAASRGLTSVCALDGETLQNLEAFRDKLIDFPPKAVCLRRPFEIEPWTDSEEYVGNLLMAWRFLITFADVLGLWPFTLDEFVQAFHDHDPRLLGEIHIALLRSVLKDIEDVARTAVVAHGTNQNSAVNPGGGHPQIVEGAYMWGFDIGSWQHHLNPLTWPEILRQFALSAGFGPKLKKPCVDRAYPCDENEGKDGADIISNLQNGVAAERAVAIMKRRGFSNTRRSRHCLTPGTVKFAAFHILSFEGSKGLTILEVAEKIQKSGLRDLTTSKTPEASISAALSRDTKLFERTAPSTYCVRAPYRKDPSEAEATLSAARERVRLLKNRIINGEEADDVDKDDERDESESEAPDDPENDDLDSESKLRDEALNFENTSRFEGKRCTENGKETTSSNLVETSKEELGNSTSSVMIQSTGASVKQSSDVILLHTEEINGQQEYTVVDESNSSEEWVEGLTEGDYFDLSVAERLEALVALICVVNEGNSIRIALEERLEMSSALKKRMWAEAQLDRRRFKGEYVVKMQYPSPVGNRAEENGLAAAGDQLNPFPSAEVNNVLASRRTSLPQGSLVDHLNVVSTSNGITTEGNLAVQEVLAGADGSLLHQSGYAVEKTRSQLKAFIGHRAEIMYEYRSFPLGQDRRRNRYWQFMTSPSRNDPGSGRIFVELRDGRWRLIDSEEGFDALLSSLDVRGARECHLHEMLRKIEVFFKETSRRKLLHSHYAEVGNYVKKELGDTELQLGVHPYKESSEGNVCIFVDTSKPSPSIIYGLGGDGRDKTDVLNRYQNLENWMWEESLSSSILCALTYRETRCKPLLSVCDYCHDLYSFDENHCPSCHLTFRTTVPFTFSYQEHVTQCMSKVKESHHMSCTSTPLRIRIIKAQIAAIEAAVPVEALETGWLEDHRKSWSIKLRNASSAEELLQILTLLEGAIKRDFLSSNYETTNELLGSVAAYNCCNLEEVAVRPWIPQTVSSVALMVKELDSSIFYCPQQKEDFQKNKGASYYVINASKYGVGNYGENVLAQTHMQAGYSRRSTWLDPGIIHTISGKGRGRGRGRGRPLGSRSGRRVSHQFSDQVSRKSRASRHSRKRGRRSVRNRKRPTQKSTGVNDEGDVAKKIMLEETQNPHQGAWEEEKTFQAEGDYYSERSGSDNDDNSRASGNEFEDLVLDDLQDDVMGESRDLAQDADYGTDKDYVQPTGDADEDANDNIDEDDEGEDANDNVDEDDEGEEDYYVVERYLDRNYSEHSNKYSDGEEDENLDEDSLSSSDYSE